MPVTFSELCIDCRDPAALASFWSAVLDWPAEEPDEDGWVEVRNPTGALPTLLFCAVPEDKVVKNRLHIDVTPPPGTQDAELERLLALGATPADVGQGDETWVVLADPEGNEFCLLRGAAAADSSG